MVRIRSGSSSEEVWKRAKVSDLSRRPRSPECERGQHEQGHRADDDEHHVLPEAAGLQAAQPEAGVPGGAGRGVDQAVDDGAVDPGVEAGQPPGRPGDAVDQPVDQAAIDAAEPGWRCRASASRTAAS